MRLVLLVPAMRAQVTPSFMKLRMVMNLLCGGGVIIAVRNDSSILISSEGKGKSRRSLASRNYKDSSREVSPHRTAA